MDDIDSLTEFKDFFHRVTEENPQMNETNTKMKLINNLLEYLGWDSIENTTMGYSVQMGANKKHVDYALSIGEQPDVFVEAKGLDTRISEKTYGN